MRSTAEIVQNAEVVLGTIKDLKSAETWLEGTFLYQRYNKNPVYYRLGSAASSSSNPDQIIESICKKDVDQLREYLLITDGAKFKATEFGEAMARYYVHFGTMKMLMCLPPHAMISEIVRLNSTILLQAPLTSTDLSSGSGL